MQNKKRGFTLIELLVVIAIIGILSSVVLASLNSARTKSRDARRVSDIKQLQIALELYFDAKRGYPSALTAANLVTPGYISVIPTDPVGGGAYQYAALNAGCTSYHLGATLEDANHAALQTDVDAVAGTAGTGCPNGAGSAADFTSVTTDAIYDVKP
ncbi:TPA: hypothetical protein DEW47_01955 [Patescibacteria group bacterium]|nr:MAG: general secretion pathway protein G [Parcubacteria group bacterium GW2011_GWB2_40_8]KKR77447.1 MAG: general secretion pathway protein G [Parcubacteria group bacterium GW2011_GWE2_40_8]HBB56455.1 hypothetical protein [Patescibacteria group bacterium]HCI04730.1 hypothetical protein [Patescibacteria group bacterium]